MKALYAVALVSVTLLSGPAFSQNAGGTVGGAVGGAAVGTVVGGPVGTVVGGAIGAIVGSSLPPQPSVVYDRPVVVGEEMPGTMTYYPVPNYDAYDYAIVNNQRVVVDRNTHRIVRVIP
jgi:phage tail tape-measure protein